MLYKILDYFYWFIVSLVTICKIFINTLLYNKAKYIIVQTLYSLLFFSGIYFYDKIWVYVYGFLLLLFVILLYYPFILIIKNKSKQLNSISYLLYKYRFLYYILYIALSVLLISLLWYFYYYPNEIVDGLLELWGISGFIIFLNIWFFLVGLFFWPFKIDTDSNSIKKKNTYIDESLLQEFKEKSWFMLSWFIWVTWIIMLSISITCNGWFCGYFSSIALTVSFISMVIHLLIWRVTLRVKNKDFMLTALENISLFTFVISLFLGLIFSLMG